MQQKYLHKYVKSIIRVTKQNEEFLLTLFVEIGISVE